ncbi:MAG: helix-turn-helix domain-containing protein, partial [Bifidobacteriaceae bacterium]|nr:helix-turn-helix domain-containing protein [Bifidobacteriaceae bacterium]
MTEESEERIEQRADALAEDHEHLLQSLIAFRTTHGLTQAEVARRMGVSQPTVAQLEHSDAKPTLSTIRRWALAVEARITTEVIDDCVDSDATW